MKFTFCVTLECNLRCKYCYIEKKRAVMPLDLARKAVDLAFALSPAGDEINFGFFGGEPLLELDLVEAIVGLIRGHADYSPETVTLSLVSNGTLFDSKVAELIVDNDVKLCISSDGPPAVQDAYRRYASQRGGTSDTVARTIRAALEADPALLVNTVYGPGTLSSLPDGVRYHRSLGVRRLFLSPDYSARWPDAVDAELRDAYQQVADLYVQSYLEGRPIFVNLIDNKIAAMLRGGYAAAEKCRMGTAELAFAPSGRIYPCERLIGGDDGGAHCIGTVEGGFDPAKMCCRTAPGPDVNAACLGCGVRPYCMNWCGCSNSFATGFYNRVSPFTCASEKEAIRVALAAFQTVEQKCGPVFAEHLGGTPFTNALHGPQQRSSSPARLRCNPKQPLERRRCPT